MPNRELTGAEKYRFGYQGQFAEEDEETGLNHFEARLWDSRLGRWLTTDPAGQYASPYLGMGNNPVNEIDFDGRQSDDCDERKKSPDVSSFFKVFQDLWRHMLGFDAVERQRDLDEAVRSRDQHAVAFAENTQNRSRNNLEALDTYVQFMGSAAEMADPSGLAGPVARIAVGQGEWADAPVIIISAVPFITGWVGTTVKIGAKAFFKGAKYSPKVLRQMNKVDDLFHSFPKSVDGYAAKFGQWSTKVGADGKTYQWLKLQGSYGGKTGTFEYIKDTNGVINHRFLNVH